MFYDYPRKEKTKDLINGININMINQMKDDISKIDSDLIINDALNSLNSPKLTNNEKNIKKDELLIQAQENAMNSFLTDLHDNKNIKYMKSLYKKQIKNFKNSTQLLIERAKKDTKEFASKYELLNKENIALKQRNVEMNNQYKELGIQNKNSLNQISQMQMRDDILIKNKYVFDEFLKLYSDPAPSVIIEQIEMQNKVYKELDYLYDIVQKNMRNAKKEFEKEAKKDNRIISDLNNQILKVGEDNENENKNLEKKINELIIEIKHLQGLKEDNNKFRKMLYQLYNRLINEYRLDKNIRIDKKFLNLDKNDYNPNLLDDIEICKYIKLMISSMNPSTSDQLLRETIAYSNMITRVYLKDKINLKYDPLSTFKELKSLMESKEKKILEYSEAVKEYETKIKKLGKENRILSKLINYFREERNHTIENKQNLTKTKNKKKNFRSSSGFNNNKSSRNIRRISTNSSYLSVRKNRRTNFNDFNSCILINENQNENNAFISFINMRNNENRAKSTKHGRHKARETIYLTPSSNKNKESNKNDSTGTNMNIIDEKNKISFIDSKLLKDPLYQSLQSLCSNQRPKKSLTANKKINKAKLKNNNKYEHQSLLTFIYEFQKLINHTNRLFMYRAKIAPSHLEMLSNNRLNGYKMKINSIKNTIKNNKMSQSTNDILQGYVKNKIMDKINGLINNMQYNDQTKKDDIA